MTSPILITGGAGFIGANLIHYLLKHHPEYSIVNIDKLTYASNLNHLSSIQNHPNYTFVKGDICNEALIVHLFETHQFTGVIHLAAESHVDNSIASPKTFIDTNITGTFNVINVAKNFWTSEPFQLKPPFKKCRFLHISTDEVYGSLGDTGFFTEKTPYAPNSPYSASKASSDFIVRSYNKTYGLPTLITNCSNNFGPFQHKEKLIPTIIQNAIENKPIPIYGNGQNIRDWLFVTDHCSAIATIFTKGTPSQTYNIGTHNEKTNLELATHICKILDKKKPKSNHASYVEQLRFVKDRAGHDKRYAIDATKIKTDLNWEAKYFFEEALDVTIEWYLKNHF